MLSKGAISLVGQQITCRFSRLAVRCPHRPSLVLHGRLRPRPVCLLSPLPEIFPSGWGRGNVPMPTVYSASAMPNRFITRITVIAPLRWVGGNVPMGAVYSSVFSSLGCDAQLLHRAHDRDRAPGIVASWRLDAAVSQRLRNLAIGGPIGCYSWP